MDVQDFNVLVGKPQLLYEIGHRNYFGLEVLFLGDGAVDLEAQGV